METNNASYSVNSVHYEGSLHPAIPTCTASEIVSGQPYQVPIGTFSVTFGEQPTYVYDVKAGKAYFRTTGNLHVFDLEDALEHGYFFGEDDTDMDGWLAAGQDMSPSKFDVVPKYSEFVRQQAAKSLGLDLPEDGILQSKPKKIHLPHIRDTNVELYTTEEVLLADFNKRGYLQTKLDDFRRYLMDYINDQRESQRGELSPNAEQWMQDLASNKYRDPADLEGIGIGLMPSRALAQTAVTRDGKAYLSMNIEFEALTQEIAARFNIPKETATMLFQEYIKAHIDSTIEHEISHLFPKGMESIFGKPGIERRVGKRQESMYGKRKSESSGRQEQTNSDLEAMAGQYKKSWSSLSRIVDSLFGMRSTNMSTSQLRSMMSNLEREGTLRGYEGDDLRQYVESKIVQYLEAESISNNTTTEEANLEDITELDNPDHKKPEDEEDEDQDTTEDTSESESPSE
tara:strand:+ start:2156 stop:3526 length:1371 start_codon:yes stop_codon:yes gene_type:complete